jgi:hypothetical protein
MNLSIVISAVAGLIVVTSHPTAIATTAQEGSGPASPITRESQAAPTHSPKPCRPFAPPHEVKVMNHRTEKLLEHSNIDVLGVLSRAMQRDCKNMVVLISSKPVEQNQALLDQMGVVSRNAYDAHGIRVNNVIQVYASSKDPQVNAQDLDGTIQIYIHGYKMHRKLRGGGPMRDGGDLANMLNNDLVICFFRDSELRSQGRPPLTCR